MIRDILKNFIFSVFKSSAPSSSILGSNSSAIVGAGTGNSGIGSMFGPSSPVVVNMTVNTPDVGGFRRAQGQIAQEMITRAGRAQRRNG